MKQIYVVLGHPGAGKTTFISALMEKIEIPTFHMGKMAKERGWKEKKNGELIEGKDEEFIEAIISALANNAAVILDGFPRSETQAKMLYELVLVNGWGLHGTVLTVSKKQSIERQTIRDEVEGKKKDIEKYLNKLKRYERNDWPAIMYLARKKVPILWINGEDHREKNTLLWLKEQKITEDTLPIEVEIAKKVAETEKEAGFSMYLSTGFIVRPFFNNRFGPPHPSFDIDIVVEWPSQKETALEILRRIAPDIRWSVASGREENENYGVHSDRWWLQLGRPLLHRVVAARWIDGKLRIDYGTPEVEKDLRSGIIRKNEQSKMGEESWQRRWKRLKMEYPGLVCPYDPVEDETWSKSIIRPWKLKEIKTKATSYIRVTPLLLKTGEVVEKDYPRNMPLKVDAPSYISGEENWEITPEFFWNALYKRTEEWRWLMWKALRNETYLELPFLRWWKKDKIFEITPYNLGKTHQYQKSTHFGRPLIMHCLLSSAEVKEPWENAEEYWLAGLRIGMLFHDIGKLIDKYTPGAHGSISAGILNKIFREEDNHMLHPNIEKIAIQVAKAHDIVGQFIQGAMACRGILPEKEASACGDEDMLRRGIAGVSKVLGITENESLRLIIAANTADVASVPHVRGYVPMYKKVSDFLLSEMTNKGG